MRCTKCGYIIVGVGSNTATLNCPICNPPILKVCKMDPRYKLTVRFGNKKRCDYNNVTFATESASTAPCLIVTEHFQDGVKYNTVFPWHTIESYSWEIEKPSQE